MNNSFGRFRAAVASFGLCKDVKFLGRLSYEKLGWFVMLGVMDELTMNSFSYLGDGTCDYLFDLTKSCFFVLNDSMS